MKNHILTILFFASTLHFFGQSLKDTIFLEKVEFSKKKEKKKVTTIKLNGHPSFLNVTNQKEIITLVRDLPKGKLKYVEFYFNCGLPNLFKKKFNINYKDVKLGLVIYNVDNNNNPDKIISQNEIVFDVNHDHSGSFKVNTESLNLYNYDKLYIGFYILSELNTKETNLYLRLNEKENAKTFILSDKSNKKYEYKVPDKKNYGHQMKMYVAIEEN